MRTYYVYILASFSGTLYIGMTNDLERRIYEHKNKLVPGFSSRYNVDRLVHIEDFSDVDQAMNRERELKGWRRSKKIDLIEQYNPGWRDLTARWFPQECHAIVGPACRSWIPRCAEPPLGMPSMRF